MTQPSYEQWEAEERQRSEDLNRRHAARLAEMQRETDDDGLTPDQRAERDAHLVKSTDDLIREAEGIPHPEPGHDVNDYRPEQFAGLIGEGPEPIDRDALKAEIKAELLEELNGGR
jgi:hypothetical protein